MTTYCATDDFIARYVRPQPGPTLIVGSLITGERPDRRLAYPPDTAIGMDMQDGPGVDLVHDLEYPVPWQLTKFANVECVSVLEHCRRPWIVAQNIEEAMAIDGSILLSVPFVWRWHGYPSDYFRFTAEGVRELFPRIRWGKLLYATTRLSEKHLLKTVKNGRYPKLPRAEVIGYGRRI